jgi:uncharacterized protein (TIGR02099 family)
VSTLHLTVKLATRLLEAAITLVVSVYLLLALGLATLRYAVLPNAQHFVPWLQSSASAALGLPVHIGSVQASWHGLLPTLALHDLVIDDAQGRPALRFASVEAQPSWKSLPRMQLAFDQLALSGVQLAVTRTDPTHLQVGGIRFDLGAPGSGAAQRFADWLFAQGQILILHSRVSWTDEVRGAAPLVLDDVNLDLRNGLLRHRLALRATPPPELGGPVELRADFHQPLFTRHDADFASWHGRLWARLPQADLGALARLLPLPRELLDGHGTLQAWADVAPHYTLAQLSADLALRGVQASVDPGLPPLLLTQLAGRAQLRRLAGGWSLALQELALRTADGVELPPLDATYSEQRIAGGGERRSIGVGGVDLGTLDALLRKLPLPLAWRDRLQALQLRGRVARLSADWDEAPGAAPTAWPARYRAQASFSDLHWAAAGVPAGLPGVAGLDGSVQADQNGGSAQLSMRDGSVALPSVFEAPELPLQRLDAQLNWNHQDGVWNVQTTRLQLANADAAGSASVRYAWHPGQRGRLDLDARLSRADARAVPRYLPLAIPAATRDYLRSAIAAGQSSDVRASVHGDLAAFPFAHPGSGTFEITARVSGGVFNAAPRSLLPHGHQASIADVHDNALWPEFSAISGVLEFSGAGLRVRDASARVYGGRLQHVSLALPDYAHPVLAADGQFSVDTGDALRYLRDSPLDTMLDHALSDVQGRGALSGSLRLTLPLDHLEQSRVQGRVQMLDDTIDYARWLPPLAGVRGSVGFDEHGFTLDANARDFLGGALHIAGGMAAQRPLRLQLGTTVSAAALRAAPRLQRAAPWLAALRGSTRVTATIAATGGAPQVTVSSDLRGLASTLPAPLAKPAASTLPLRVDVNAQHWSIDLGGGLLRADLQPGAAGLRGAAALGRDATLPAADGDGLRLAVALPTLDVDAWRAFTAAPGAGAGSSPQALTLRVQQLTLTGRRFDDVVLAATRSGALWQSRLSSRELAGQIDWRVGAGSAPGSVTARLSRLIVPQGADPDVERMLDEPLHSIPALDISADDVELHGHHFDHLELQATNRRVGKLVEWRLTRLRLSAPEATLSGSGDWVAVGAQSPAGAPARDAQRRFALGFKLDIADAGGLLARLGKPGLLRGGAGVMQGTVAWLGSPLSPDYASLSGQFKLDLGKGQFLKADPGLAKLLGVLSLQSLPRRLLFNFSDLFESGFAFDRAGADVELYDGVATTHNFSMHGPAATVFIAGSADLAAETQDLYVVVVPEINAGSASLAYALINPAVGLGTFVAQLIARKPLMKAFTYGYRVTGTWTKPDVKSLEHPDTPH